MSGRACHDHEHFHANCVPCIDRQRLRQSRLTPHLADNASRLVDKHMPACPLKSELLTALRAVVCGQRAGDAAIPDCPACGHDSTHYQCAHCGETWPVPADGDQCYRPVEPQRVNERDSRRELQRLESLNAELRGRVAAIVRRCDEIERKDEFYEAALAFARAHVESDRIDKIDDADDPDISEARWTESCARYNETKAALVAAYLALSGPPGRAEGTPTAARSGDHNQGEVK